MNVPCDSMFAVKISFKQSLYGQNLDYFALALRPRQTLRVTSVEPALFLTMLNPSPWGVAIWERGPLPWNCAVPSLYVRRWKLLGETRFPPCSRGFVLLKEAQKLIGLFSYHQYWLHTVILQCPFHKTLPAAWPWTVPCTYEVRNIHRRDAPSQPLCPWLAVSTLA